MSVTKEEIEIANQTNLAEYLVQKGEKIIPAGKSEVRWKAHDSVTIKDNMWYQHSQSKGGFPASFVMEFEGLPFPDAINMLLKMKGYKDDMTKEELKEISKANANLEPSISAGEVATAKDLELDYDEVKFSLPEPYTNNDMVRKYLMQDRGLDHYTVDFFQKLNMIYEDKDYHNVVFVGYDSMNPEKRVPKFATKRSIKDNIKMDVLGSDKAYSFWFVNKQSDILLVFEAPIDMMSFLKMYYGEKEYPNCVSLGGVGSKAMHRILNENRNIRKVCLCLDDDKAGNDASNRIADEIYEKYDVARVKPTKKDWNEVLIAKRDNPTWDNKPVKFYYKCHEKVSVINMSDIEEKEVDFIWNPYIARGKITIIQGDGGIGKTTLITQIVAKVTKGEKLPGMEENPGPMNVFIQSAEDGYADTIKPRLGLAGADMNRVKIIDETEKPLTLYDERIYRAIIENKISMIIFDPIQGYLGEADMNRAFEMRPIFKKLCQIAEETNCAIVLIGHLNKNNSASIAQRSLGSTDVYAAARSVLTVAKINNDDEKRIMCHTKSNLAPVGQSIEFELNKDSGFIWKNISNLKIEDVMSGKCANAEDGEELFPKETKTELAMRKIVEFLESVEEIRSPELEEKITGMGISTKTYNNARAKLSSNNIIKCYQKNNGWYIAINKKE